jgi:thioesterase-3
MNTRTTIKVRAYHTDGNGHVHHARYLEFLEEARWAYCEENGITESLFSAKGISHAAVALRINYRRSAKIGDSLLIVTGVSKKGKRSFTMGQKMYLGETDELIVDAEVTNVLLDSAGAVLPVDDEIVKLWPDLLHCHGLTS